MRCALPFIVALLLTVAFGFVLGLVLERGILRWVYDKGFMATLLASWGVGTVLEQGVAAIFTVSQKGVDSPLKGKLTIGDFSYPAYRVVVAVGIVALLAILLLLVYRTTLGLRLRASIDNVEMASVLGISPQRMFAMVFSVATALAVLAGALIAPTIAINPTLGLSFLAPAFSSLGRRRARSYRCRSPTSASSRAWRRPGRVAPPFRTALARDRDGPLLTSRRHSAR